MHIFLFHRDLRLQDNTSLIYQIKKYGEVVPIFIFPPEQINKNKNQYFSNNSVQFMIESLQDLNKEIREKNGKMYFFEGDNLTVLKTLHKSDKIESISFNIDYTPYAKKRDYEIQEWCKKNDIDCIQLEDYYLYNILDDQTKKSDGKPYLVYTPFRNHCMSDLVVRKVDKYSGFKFDKIKNLEKNKYYLNSSDITKFYIDNSNINIHGGRKNALKILANISKFKTYQRDRDTLTYKTTFLGAHLHFTTVSIREVYHKMVDKLGIKSGLINELHWRDFYANITHEFPHILKGQIKGNNLSYKKDYDNIKWSYNKKLFRAWCTGTTGFPVVDAAMRQLNTTGFMHNRCRMIVASFLTKDMHIDWKDGEKYFATKLVDYDPISNNGGWQWSAGSGTDAQPYFRIFNPWTQQENFDYDCKYIKYWLPELKNVPNKDIHKWYDKNIHKKWLLDEIDYVEPILDHDSERKKTIGLYNTALK